MSKLFLFTVAVFFSSSSFCQKTADRNAKIRFNIIANGKKLLLTDSSYINEFGEKYTISKLRYYISNLGFITSSRGVTVKNTFLADAGKENIFRIQRPSGEIRGITFLLGVDSLLNCNGARSGALDPLNDMFWTWNSGYVMFKLEGTADSSNADLHRIEQHIGGYKGEYKTMRQVKLYFKNAVPNNLTIQLDLDKYWSGLNKIYIARTPIITTVGEAAKRSADNFPGMFSIKQ